MGHGKWQRAGPKLNLTVSSVMKSFNIPEYEGKTLIMAYVVNSGNRPTTRTHMVIMRHANLWNRLRKKADNTFLIQNPNLHQRIPYELKPGTNMDWNGGAE